MKAESNKKVKRPTQTAQESIHIQSERLYF